MLRRDESRVVVGHHHRRIAGQLIDHPIIVRPPLPQIEAVPHAQLRQPPLLLRHPLQHKRVHPVVRLPVSARQPLIHQQRQPQFIRLLRRIRQRVVTVRAPVHLTPVQDILRARSWRGII